MERVLEGNGEDKIGAQRVFGVWLNGWETPPFEIVGLAVKGFPTKLLVWRVKVRREIGVIVTDDTREKKQSR